jgi:hypothetical protein
MFFKKPTRVVVEAPAPSRAELLAQLATLERTAAEASEALAVRITARETAAQRDRAAWLASLQLLNGLRAQRASESDRLHQERNTIHRQLEQGADPLIAAALRRLDVELERVRALRRDHGVNVSDRIQLPSLRPLLRDTSNRPALRRVTEAARAAREALEALFYRDVEDLPAAIAAIEATVPWDTLGTRDFDDEDERPEPGRTWGGSSAA